MPTEETVATLATPETDPKDIETTQPPVEGETPGESATPAHDDKDKEHAKALRQRARAKAEAEAAKAEADYWRKRALAEAPKTEEPKPAQSTEKPKLADFVAGEQPTAEEWEQFTDALTDWKADKAVQKVRADSEQATAKQREQAERKEMAANYAKSQSEAREVLKDYDEVLEYG